MNIKKKLGMGAATAILGLGLIGGGTFAYFSDTETTNNTFAAGTLDLGLSTDKFGNLNFSLKNLKPGDYTHKQVQLYNEGSLDIKDVKVTADYEVKDAKGDNGSEDFADHIIVTIYNPQTNVVKVDKVPLSQLDEKVINQGIAPGAREILTYRIEFKDNGQDQNIFQGDGLDVTFTYEASQTDGEER